MNTTDFVSSRENSSFQFFGCTARSVLYGRKVFVDDLVAVNVSERDGLFGFNRSPVKRTEMMKSADLS
jgi:hypothetical protein